ncbi:YbgA family protein [Desulfuromusa kysingii]|nr:YbgA family protein [Desulfuromusa kysingii]
MAKEKIRLGICPGLIDIAPGFAGDNDLASFVTSTLASAIEYVFVCPDVGEERCGQNALQREDFMINTFVLKRWLKTLGQGKTAGNLVDFHSRHKYLIMARWVESYRQMGKLVARSGEMEAEILYQDYLQLLLNTLRLNTTIPKHVNVLQHIFGYFKKHLSAAEKQEVMSAFDRFRTLQAPLIVPITLLNHLAHKYQQPYLLQQVYLNPSLLASRQGGHV